MQVPSAELILSIDSSRVTVHPGTLIGRLAHAGVVIADPRVSEAHALVSLRCRSLRLLALRGALTVQGCDVDAVTLAPGVQVELADGLSIAVESVTLPTHGLVLCGTTPGPVELGASTCSLLAEGPGLRVLRLVAGFVPGAAGHLWYSGSRLWIRPRGQDAEPLEIDGRWTIEGRTLQVVQVPLDGTHDTGFDRGGPFEQTSIVLVARYVTVHVYRGSGTSVITGKPANLVSELVRFAGKPVPWMTVSRQIWGERPDRESLRRNFDTTLARLRRQLRDLAIREDLVGLDGAGNVELVLYPGDRMVDES